MKKPSEMKSERTPQWFENWCRRAKMRPVCKVEDKDGAVLIADSGQVIYEDDKAFFRTGYAIVRRGVQLGAFNNYEPVQFFRDGPVIGQETRINDALKHARKLKRQLEDVDYWPGAIHA